MSRPLPVAVAQVLPVPLDSGSRDFAEGVASLLDDFPNTRLAIYPELHLFGVAGHLAERSAQLRAAAEPLDGPRVKLLGELAADLGVWLMPGTVCEDGGDGALYNTAAVFSPTGELMASYRKCFPWRPYCRPSVVATRSRSMIRGTRSSPVGGDERGLLPAVLPELDGSG